MEQQSQVLKQSQTSLSVVPKPSRNLSVSGRVLTKEIFTKAVKSISLCFPNLELTETRLKVWYELLKDLSLEQLRKGMVTFLRNHPEIYPNTNVVAHIRKYGLSTELNYPTAIEAWGMVLKEIGRTGSYGTPKIPNDMVQRAVEMIGWRDICLSDNVEASRAHFFRAYESLIKREQDLSVLGPAGGEA